MKHPKVVGLGLAALLALGACSSTNSTQTPGASSTTTTSGGGAGTTNAGSTPTTAAGFSVNTASQAEIADVLTKAGVPNAQKWAREVAEYRPYDTSDENMTHLRDELAKYNPSQETVDQIVAALQG